MPLESANFFSGCDIPQAQHVFIATPDRDDVFAVGSEYHPSPAAVGRDRMEHLPCMRVPDDNLPAVRARRQHLAVGRERRGPGTTISLENTKKIGRRLRGRLGKRAWIERYQPG